MASAKKLWQPIGEDEIKDWRKRLPEGHVREDRVGTHASYDTVEAEGDQVTLTQNPVSMAGAAIPREVAEDIFGQIYNWATSNRQAYQLMVKIMRQNNPAEFGHLSDDELEAKIKQHAQDAARKAVEDTYRGQWDKGNDLDMWQGKPVTP